MIFKNAGKITDDLYMLGSPGMPVFLVIGDNPVLIDAGFSCLGKLYVKEVRKTINRDPAYCLLTHVHFDHCGGVSVYKNAFSQISVCCSQKGKEILDKPNAIKVIKDLNREAKNYVQKQFEVDLGVEGEFEPFHVDRVLKQNDLLQISPDMAVQAIETPGHTRDHLSYYIPDKKILFSGESLGISNSTGYIHTEALADFDLYLDSMDKLSELDVEVLCLGHNYVYTGSDVRDYLESAKKQAIEFKDWVDACMKEENREIDKVMEKIKSLEYDPEPPPKQPEGAYMLNLRAKIEAISNRNSK